MQINGEDLWVALARPGLFIDADLKLILQASKFDNLPALAKLTEGDISEMQQFMQTTLHLLLEEDDIQKYYGIFHKKPDKFVFVCGQIKALKNLAAVAKETLTPSRSHGSSKKQQTKPATGRKDPVQGEEQPLEKPDDKILNLQTTLINSTSTYLASHHPELKYADDKVNIDCTVSANGRGSFSAEVKCPFVKAGNGLCTKLTHVSMNQKRWNPTNFYTHVHSHFKPPKEVDSAQSIKDMMEKKK